MWPSIRWIISHCAAAGEAACRAAAFGDLLGMRRAVGAGEKLRLTRRRHRRTWGVAIRVELHHWQAVEVILQSLDQVTDGVEEVLRGHRCNDPRR